MSARARSSAFATLMALTALAFVSWSPVAKAETEHVDTPSGSPVPRWAQLRRSEVYARSGPSRDNRNLWTYRAAGMPVQIISETRDWRLICDIDGGVAWVSRTMLQSQKTVMSPDNGKKLELRASPEADAKVKAYLRPRAVAQLGKCKKGWCKISAGGQTGWVAENALWGKQTKPVCERPKVFTRK